MQLTQKERAAFSIANLMREMASDRPRGSFESELMHDLALREGRAFNPQKVRLPWSLLTTRDLNAASSGAYITGTSNTDVADALRPFSIVVQSGATVLGNLTGNITIPRVTGDAVGAWLSSELDPVAPSQPTLGQVSLVPHTAAALTSYTKLLEALNPQTEAFIKQHLLRVVGAMIDAAALNGSGVEGEPTGLTKVTGVDTVSGTDFALADALSMAGTISAAGGEVTSWIGAPTARETLGAREKAATGNGWVWDGDTILGKPAFATKNAPANSLFCGAWNELIVASWGSGIDVSVDAYTGWSTGVVSVRVLAMVDIGVPNPAAFSFATSIT